MQMFDVNLRNFDNDEMIELKKKMNNYLKQAREQAKDKCCLICGQEKGFCDSHTIPQFCLKNIAWNGKINSFYYVIDTDIMPEEMGVKNAGRMRIICRDCDGKNFQDYEKAEAYNNVPNSSVLNQIALKNSLYSIYKHKSEIEMYNISKMIMQEKDPILGYLFSDLINAQIEARNLDLQESCEIFSSVLQDCENNNSNFRLVSFDRLDYTVPIAFQGMIALVTGVNGEIINDNYNDNTGYKIEYLHIAVFPLEDSTAVLMFLPNAYQRYEQFEKYIANECLEKRLEIINRIIFLYAEDYYLSKEVPDSFIEELNMQARLTQDMFSMDPEKSTQNAVKDFDLRRETCIPNLLSSEYSIQNLMNDKN